LFYQHGRGGCQVSIEKAVKWFQRSASQSHAPALYSLAGLYLTGYGAGVPRDINKALALYEKAAGELDHADSQYQLGMLFLNSSQLENSGGAGGGKS
jgi:TPR repeat protein